MNKKIKVIDLLNMIAEGKEVPKRIKINNILYYWDIDDRCYIDEDTDNWVDNIDLKWLEGRISIDSKKDLNLEVEIIEVEPEIDIQGIKLLNGTMLKNVDETTFKAIADIGNKVGELILAIKQLDNKLKEKE